MGQPGGQQAALQDQGPVPFATEDQRVVDRERGTVRELDREREVVLGVRPPARGRRERRDAHQLAPSLQRNGQHRAHPDRPRVRRRALRRRQRVVVHHVRVQLGELRRAARYDLGDGMSGG